MEKFLLISLLIELIFLILIIMFYLVFNYKNRRIYSLKKIDLNLLEKNLDEILTKKNQLIIKTRDDIVKYKNELEFIENQINILQKKK